MSAERRPFWDCGDTKYWTQQRWAPIKTRRWRVDTRQESRIETAFLFADSPERDTAYYWLLASYSILSPSYHAWTRLAYVAIRCGTLRGITGGTAGRDAPAVGP